jgi:hypothetical protein
MIVNKIGIPSVLRDNDMQYISCLLNIIETADKDADVTISLSQGSYTTYISLSQTKRRSKLVADLKSLHGSLMLNLEFYPGNNPSFLKFSLI